MLRWILPGCAMLRAFHGDVDLKNVLKNRFLARNWVLALLLVLVCALRLEARFRFLSPVEMIQYADVIAIGNIVDVVAKDTPGGDKVVFRQRATAKIEQIIKGSAGKSLDLVAGVTSPDGNRLCLPDCTLEAGWHLMFVRKTAGSDYVTANAGLGMLRISGNNKLSWFAEMGDLSKRVETSLPKMIADIKANLKTGP